jgi:hypothetical protein
MANAYAHCGVNRSCALRPSGEAQTLGGRSKGGVTEPAVTCIGTGESRKLKRTAANRVSEAGMFSGWKHLTMQVPMSGQNFCGQFGQCLAGWWHGISAIASDAAGAPPAMASAYVDDIGAATRALSMASIPRTTNQRWCRRFFTKSKCHSHHNQASLSHNTLPVS